MRRALALLGLVLLGVILGLALSRRAPEAPRAASAAIEPSPPAPVVTSPQREIAARGTAAQSPAPRLRQGADGGLSSSFEYDQDKDVTIEWPPDGGRPRIHPGDARP